MYELYIESFYFMFCASISFRSIIPFPLFNSSFGIFLSFYIFINLNSQRCYIIKKEKEKFVIENMVWNFKKNSRKHKNYFYEKLLTRNFDKILLHIFCFTRKKNSGVYL